MSRSIPSHWYLIAALSSIGVGGNAIAADAATPTTIATCDVTAADPFDPRNDSGEGIEERKIPILDAYFACKAVLETGDLSPRTVYQIGRAALVAGDLQLTQQAGNKGAELGYPAAFGLLTRLFTRNLERTVKNADELEKLTDAATAGGYPHVHYHVGLGLEQLVTAIAGRPRALYGKTLEQLLERMTDAYAEAARATDAPQAWYRSARAQFLHRHLSGEGPKNASAEADLARAAEAGLAGAIFYRAVKAAVEADPADEATLRASLTAWRQALLDDTHEAVAAGLMRAVDWEALRARAELKGDAGKVFATAVMLFKNTVLVDPFLNPWYQQVAEMPLDAWGADKTTILMGGLERGVLPAGQALIDDDTLDVSDSSRDSILLAAALNVDSRHAPWIRTAVQRTYLTADNVDPERLRLGFETAKILAGRQVPEALLDAGLVGRRLGNRAIFIQAVNQFFQPLAEKPEDQSVSDHERTQRLRAFGFLNAIYDGGAGEEIPELHRIGLKHLGAIYVNAAMDFYRYRASEAYKAKDVPRMDTIYQHGQALAGLSREAQARFDEYIGKKIPAWKRDLHLRTQPVCEKFKAKHGPYLIKANHGGFEVNRYDTGGYEYGETHLAGGDTGYRFLMFIDAPADGDAQLRGFRSDEHWMRPDGRFDVTYDAVFNLYGWFLSLGGDAARAARDRALRGGATTLSFEVVGDGQRRTAYSFADFRAAYDKAQEKHRELRAIHDRLECRQAVSLPF